MKQAAEGSVLVRNGTAVGSSLVGQPFSDPMHFMSRPPGFSNWGPYNPALISNVSQQVAYEKALNPSMSLGTDRLGNAIRVGNGSRYLSGECPPPDSAHIERHEYHSKQTYCACRPVYGEPDCRHFGEPRVNVLEINIALDGLMNTKLCTRRRQCNGFECNSAQRFCYEHNGHNGHVSGLDL